MSSCTSNPSAFAESCATALNPIAPSNVSMSLDGLGAATGGSTSARDPCSTTNSGLAGAAGLGALAARGAGGGGGGAGRGGAARGEGAATLGEGATTLGPVGAGRAVGAARAAGIAGDGATAATISSV